MAGSRVESEESRVEIETKMKRGGDVKDNGEIVNGESGDYHSEKGDLDLKGKLNQTADGDSVNGELKGKEETFGVDRGDNDGKIEQKEGSENSVEGRLNGNNCEQEREVKVDIEQKLNALGLGLNGDLSMVEMGVLKTESREIEGKEGPFVKEGDNGDDKIEEKREDMDLVEERPNGYSYEEVKVDLEEEQSIIGSNGDSSMVENGELMPENKEIAGKEDIVVKESGEEDDRGGEVEVDDDAICKVEEIEKEDNLVVEGEKKEMGVDDKDLGSSEAEEKEDIQALNVEEEEKEVVSPHVEEHEAVVVLAKIESLPEIAFEIDKEDIKVSENLVAGTHFEESELPSHENEVHKVVDDEKGDVGSIKVQENQNRVDDAEDTENVAELKSSVEAELRQEPRIEKTVNVEELESSVEVEQKPELDSTVEETKTLAEPEIVVEEAKTVTELELDAEIELKQDSDTLVEEEGKDEADKKTDLKVAVKEDSTRSAIVVEPEHAKDVASEHVPLEKVGEILNSGMDLVGDLVEERPNGYSYEEEVKVDPEGSNGDSSMVENGELMPGNKEIAGKEDIIVKESGEEGDREGEVGVDEDAICKVEEIEKEDNLVVEGEEEMGLDDKDLGSSGAEEKQNIQALYVKEVEKGVVSPHVEEQEAEVVITKIESQPEVAFEIDKVDIKVSDNVAAGTHFEDSESPSHENEVHKVVDDEKGDVGSIKLQENQNLVGDAEDTENVAELKSNVEVGLKQEPRIEKTINVEELESSVEVEQKPELDTTVEETKTVGGLEIVVEEAKTITELELDAEIELKQDSDTMVEKEGKDEADEKTDLKVAFEELTELELDAEIELKQDSDTVVEEEGKDEADEKTDLKVAVDEDGTRSAVVVELEQAKDVASEHVPLEKVGGILNSDSDAVANEPSDQLQNGIMNLAAGIRGDSLEDELNDKARYIQFGCFEVPSKLRVARNELVEEISVSTVDKNVEVEVSNGETVPSEFNTDISPEDKTDSKCMVSSIEWRQSTNKDDDEEPSREVTQIAEMTLAPPEARVVKKQFVYMIKVPRFIDDELQKQIRLAKSIVDEKTRFRDSISEEKREQLAIVKESSLDYTASLAKENDARAAVMLKRQELEKVQEKINRLNNVNSIADVDKQIRHMKHRQQHETMSLKQEKQYIQEINRMTHIREQLSLKQAPQEQINEAVNQRDEIEAQLMLLKKELATLKAASSSAENSRKSAWNKHMDEQQRLDSLKEKHSAANDFRQEAYQQLTKLRNQSAEMARHFQNYKSARLAVDNYKFSGDNQGLISHCSSQVEGFFDLWNNNKEFRNQYVKSNTYSTLKRLETLDGRSLGPGEERPVFRPYLDKSLSKTESDSNENLTESSTTNQPAKVKYSTKPTLVEGDVNAVSISRKSKKEEDGEKMRKKEEKMSIKSEELARKEDELRKEKEAKEKLTNEKEAKEEEGLKKEKKAAELKEQLRLEQREKAREAEERKRRKAVKVLARAEYRLQKEAELKEKKKAKKEKKKAGFAVNMTSSEDTYVLNTSIPDTKLLQTSQEPEILPGPPSKRRCLRPASSVRQQNRVQDPLPLTLRNKSKRKMKTWMQTVLVVLLVLVVFLAGNYISFSTSSLPNFGF